MPRLSAKSAAAWGRTDYYVDLLPSLTGTRRKRVFGPTPDEAVERAETWLQERRALGPLQDITTPERAFLLRYRGILSLPEMEAACARAAEGRISQVTVEVALAEYTREAKRNWTPHTQGTLRWALGEIEEAFRGRPVASLKPRELSEFLARCGRSAPNFRRWLNAFLNWAWRVAEYTDRNPLQNVPRITLPRESKAILSAPQMTRLLQSARQHAPSLAFLILGGFAGLRTCESLRARWGDLRGKVLHIPNMKTQKRGIRERHIELNETALAWLALIPRGKAKERIVPNNEANLRRNLRKVCRLARVRWIDNALRRSYGSYHLALHQDGAKTASLMGHTSAETTFAHYRRSVTQAQGRAWFALRP